ncbi:MAG: NAD(+)/NADH kinase [Peptococcaceae bacterium]|jgi:NAD+ kinase|nr:NAD(+)/NADH kinase [Peptococcaceae bacterium]
MEPFLIRNIGLVINPRLRKSMELAAGLADWLRERRYEVGLVQLRDYPVPKLELPPVNLGAGATDMVIAMGGDGTLLSAARATGSLGVPILGVNMGNLGFLTEVESGSLYQGLTQVLEGRFYLEQRMMLRAVVRRKNKIIREITGLNDVVVHKGSLSRLVEIDSWVGDDFVGSYKGDGVIIASPTGSTAYALSAGGPIVHPSLEVMVQVWICPHTITARPAIIPAHKACALEVVDTTSEVQLTVDGQDSEILNKKDQILVTKATEKATFIRLKPLDFYSILKKKLGSGTIGRYE